MKRINGIILTLALLVAGAITVKAQKSETLANHDCSITYSFSGGKITESNEEHPFEHYYKVDISPGETITASAKANKQVIVNDMGIESKPYIQFVFRAFDDAGKEIKNETHTSAQMHTVVNFSYTVPANCDHIELHMGRPIIAPRYAFVEVTFNVKKNATATTPARPTQPTTPSDNGTASAARPGKIFTYCIPNTQINLKYRIITNTGSSHTCALISGQPQIKMEKFMLPDFAIYQGIGFKVVSLDNKALYNQKNLKYIITSKFVTSIGDNAFAKCPNLVSIQIARDLNHCGKGITAYSPKVSFITLANGNKYRAMNNCLIEWSQKKLLAGCQNTILNNLHIKGLTIASGAFAGSGIDEQRAIIVAENVNIERNAFKDCKKLRKFVIASKVWNINSDSFDGCSNLLYIDVKKLPKDQANSSLKNCPAKFRKMP